MANSVGLLIIGGGRWSRTTVLELVKISEISFQIVVLSKKNHANMVEWVRINGLDHQVKVIDDISETDSNVELIYVANESKLRFETLKSVLKFEAPTLVEKPFMLNAQDALSTIKNFEDVNVTLYSANVLRYLHSLEVFRNAILNRDVLSIKFIWEDLADEFRHGEKKKYEKDIPVYTDVFPHFCGVLNEFFPGLVLQLVSVSSHDHFKDVTASFTLNSKVLVDLDILRFGKKRKRIIEARTREDVLTLDFSETECVVYSLLNGEQSILYSGATAGIQEMFQDFYKAAKNGTSSVKLDPLRSLECLKLCDEVSLALLS
jgi:predicted dehydrogenase